MESVTILSLNDDCLCIILSYINDFSSFYNFSLTCKRFNELTLRERNWHINVLKRKADFYIRQFVLYNGESKEQLVSLLGEGRVCSIRHLSHPKILHIWESCGPVAAKLLTWIKSFSSEQREDGPRETCSTEYRSVSFHLPSCDQELSIDSSHFVDYIGNYDRETTINASCGDLKIEKDDLYRIIPEDYDYWSEGEMTMVVDPIKPLIELLQKELGDTVPPITDKFAVWFCFLFPDHSLQEQDKLHFKDDPKNAKPTLESVQDELDRYSNIKSGQFRKPLEKWMEGKEESHCAKMLARALEILVQKSQTRMIRQFGEDISRFTCATSFNENLREVPKKAMLDLMTRTTLFPGDYSAATVADKCIENKVYFRMKGGFVIKVDGKMRGDGASYPTWFQFLMNFHLPDGNTVAIQSPDLKYRRLQPKDQQILAGKFSPITEILQECIDECMKDEENIPKINNKMTIHYFMRLLEFSEVIESFFK